MSSLPILSTACFPPISYLALMAQSGRVVIDPYENYSKQSFRNRYEIYGPNGRQTLSLPIVKISGQKIQLIQTQIEQVTDWQKVHLRSLEAAYANTPFFEYYYPEIEELILSRINSLFEFNQLILKRLLRLFKVSAEIRLSEVYLENTDDLFDYREAFHPKFHKRKPSLAFKQMPYYQIFQDKYGFQQDLSCLDLLFHLGPDSEDYLLHQCNF